MGTEAGESLASILDRKERERQATGGLFLWGIGNAVGAALEALVRRSPQPEVLFSCTKTPARLADASPDRRVVWAGAVTMSGRRYQPPKGTRVMGGVVDARRLPPRFALVCSSDQSLQPSDHGSIRLAELRNLVSGHPVGASQVTAVVERVADDLETQNGMYVVRLRARLVEPYFVRLVEPIVVSEAGAGSELGDAILA
ncbi:MAG: hypothetical protein QOH61_739 [Chloroflexota bacterium]|jgi:hypothetical protein|nr:hypothetical protein [Chloroflexota bacterium]